MKKLFLLSLLSFITVSIYSMPVFESYIPDSSGEYVYYKDTSFKRISYLGILYYDDSTFQVRYYAPADSTQLLPEKDLSILMNVNPQSSHWEMTGERILGTVLPESNDTEIVNYLHDIMYEFSSRRSKTEIITPQNQTEESTYTDFPQFGGNVKINYDYLVPLFNIRSITSEKGDKVLDCITYGNIKSTTDTSFDNFKGFKTIDKKSLPKTKISKAKAQPISFNSQEITVDSNWKQQMQNIWTYKDDSLLTMVELPLITEDEALSKAIFTRKFLLSTGDSYTDLSTVIISQNNNQTKISSQIYQQNNNRIVYNTKIITKKNNNFDYLSIATYQSAYETNQSYFEKIVKSYKN